MLQRVLAAEAHLLAVADFHRTAASCGLAVALAHGHPGLVVIGIYVEAVDTRLHHGKRQVRGINFVDFARFKMANRYFENALVELRLYGVVANVGEGKAALRTQAKITAATFRFNREFFSAQTRSELVNGRFRLAATQSLTPPGCIETSPEMN